MNIRYIAIHCNDYKDRYENLQTQEEKLGQPIEIFPAIMGPTIVSLADYDKHLRLNSRIFLNEIGCYLSHFMVMKQIQSANRYIDDCGGGYTVIFEDDIDIQCDDLHTKIQSMIEEENSVIPEDIDIVYLGTIGGDHKRHAHLHIQGDIYHINPEEDLWGTHAYMVRNRSLEKIIRNLYNITNPLDVKYKELFTNGTLKGACISPSIVKQNETFPSYVRKFIIDKNGREGYVNGT